MYRYIVTFAQRNEVEVQVDAEKESEAIRKATKVWQKDVPEVIKVIRQK